MTDPRICDIFDKLKVGMEVETFGDWKEIGIKRYTGKIIYKDYNSFMIDSLDAPLIHESCPAIINILNNKKERKIMSNLIERCKSIFLTEPEKSFRKAEITLSDGFLTLEGTAVFIKWLLSQNADKFKKEVVDEILKDKEEDKE